jgi:group II intron reverse transcriptase/maturase
MNKSEVSQAKEGLNVFWFLIHKGNSSGLALGKRNRLEETRMIERVLHPHNMQRALKQVIANKGSAGVDRMSVKELTEHVRKSRKHLYTSIKEMEYLPQAILGVEIPKGGGKTRLLGVPTVTDRLLQQAVSQVLMPVYESEFSVNSYGFRPNKNARQAVGKALEHIHEGYTFIVDIDLKTFFDEVDHCLLLNLLYQKVKCPITLRLIRKWLRAPIQINGKLHKRRKGVPQGSPLSPLLSNILLNELDKELTRRNLRFVRYADDFSIYTKCKSHATATLKAIAKWLKTKLKLTINREKSGVRKPIQFEILGFGFEPTYKKGDKGKYQLVISKKAWKRLKQRLKTISRKTTPMRFEDRIQKINEVQRGWLNYFRGTSIKGKLKELDGWLRNRLRYCIWHHWKKPERKRKNLIRLGIDQDHAYAYSRTRMGGWAVAQSPVLRTTITISRLKKRGYIAMLELHLSLNPSRYEPPYTRTVRTVV